MTGSPFPAPGAGQPFWFLGRANGTPVAHMDDAPASFDIGAIIASAEAFSLRVVGPPPATDLRSSA
ncbi:hypothetical protein ACFPIJ_24865 [Dactylosporangium cerinum]|uniref:Uncharacterized protein n=1 Tax=Dactylosporangium cerinum TaxID=1434730 RepID=A0ABV9VZ78_9ACTN